MEVIREGTAYDFGPTKNGQYAYLVGEDGWGMAPIRRLAQRGPQQDGETDVGLRLDPRYGQLVFDIPGSSWSDLQAKRTQLLAMFGPTDDPLTIRWNRTGTNKCIDVHYIGDLDFGSGDREGYLHRVAVTLKAPDPTFYDPTVATKTFELGGGSDTLVVPMAVPHKVGASTADMTSAINYAGTWHSFPHLIRIVGPITDCVITNILTGEFLDFTGTTIASSDWYDIDLRWGYKTVVDKNGVNRIDKLTDDSDLATWHIEKGPAPGTLSSPMSNSINITGTSITATSKVEMAYYVRYLGI